MPKEEKILHLVKQIMYHKRLYYSGKALVSDAVYDSYEDCLRKLDPTNPVLDYVGYSEEEEKNVKTKLGII